MRDRGHFLNLLPFPFGPWRPFASIVFYARGREGPVTRRGKVAAERDLAVVFIGKNALTRQFRGLNSQKEGGAIVVAELTLFGGFELRLAGEAVELPGQKDRALLAVLALRPGATQSRDKLAGLLWSERGDPQARDSLKHALTRLRQCLAPASPPPIVADRQSVRLDPAAFAIDVALFEQHLADGSDDALERAATLYRGDLLDGIAVHDPSFEDWLAVERQRLRQAAEDALSRLMARSMAAGAPDRAAIAARRLLSLDPLREAACRTLMQIDTERSRTAQALKLFETLRDRLHRELGVSRMRWLLVIARNSSFTYRGRAVDVKQTGRELGVRYVLEGSVTFPFFVIPAKAGAGMTKKGATAHATED
jgi:DNA-binding SARP family transcriptional activator